MKGLSDDPSLPLRAVAGACVVLLGSLALLVGGDLPARMQGAPPAESRAGTNRRSGASPTGLVHSPGSRSPVGSERGPAAPAETAEPAGRFEDRVGASVLALASALEGAPFDRQEWETRVAATASSLGPSAVSALRRSAGRRQSTLSELVAAAEILRGLPREAGAPLESLPGHVLSSLRAAVARIDLAPATRVVASRSLGAFGRRSDTLGFAEQLIGSADPSERSLAAWALGAGSRTVVMGCLAELLSPEASPEEVERSLCLLSSWSAASEPDALDPGARTIIAETARRALRDGNAPVSLRTRAITVLTSISPGEARLELIEVLASPGESARLRQLAVTALLGPRNPDAAGDAEFLWRSPDLSADSRLVLAEAIVRDGAPRDSSPRAQALREEALDLVAQALTPGGDPIRQRRTLQALAEVSDPRVGAIIDRVLDGDPVASVRAAALAVRGR